MPIKTASAKELARKRKTIRRFASIETLAEMPPLAASSGMR
jgi:hypothetical protein